MIDGEFSEPLQQVDRTCVRYRGRRLIYFGGCDYLRLSFHPKVLRAVKQGIDRYGLNVAASRRTTGNHEIYEDLERATAKFFDAERAVFASNAYLANIIVGQGLRDAIDHVFLDERAHSSLRDATAFLPCPKTEFSHCNPRDLELRLKKFRKRDRIAVLTDGLFGPDGTIAPLAEYRKVAGPDTRLWVDDAHAAGVLGARGRGSIEETGLDRRNVIQTVTFSKAFGVYGGAILCDRQRAEEIIGKSAALTGNTPAPLPLAVAALRALEICRTEPSRREKLWKNIALFWKQLGRDATCRAPIISVVTARAAELKRRLLASGIYPSFIDYGSGPGSHYFRFALSSEHTSEQIKKLARTLAASSRKSGKDRLLFPGVNV